MIARKNASGDGRGLVWDAPSDSPPQSPFAFATTPLSCALPPNLPSNQRAHSTLMPPPITQPPVSPTPTFRPPTAEATVVSAERAWRRGKERKRATRKKLQLRGSSSQGHLTANPALVQRCLASAIAASPPSKDFSANTMQHANTGYLGLGGKIVPRDFGLDELVGEGSKYGFELRRCGRSYEHAFLQIPRSLTKSLAPHSPSPISFDASSGCASRSQKAILGQTPTKRPLTPLKRLAGIARSHRRPQPTSIAGAHFLH